MTYQTCSERLSKLYDVISDSLQRPRDQMTEDKRLFIDFKIESVEALELEFALEEAFDTKIELTDLWKLPTYLVNKGMVQGGVFTEDARKLIREKFPLLKPEEVAAMQTAKDLYREIRIKDIEAFLSKVCK